MLEGEGEAAEGPVMDVLPGMVPATGQYYLAMRWVDKVRQGEPRSFPMRDEGRGSSYEVRGSSYGGW